MNSRAMSILLRAAVALAIAVPVFAAIGFRPALWQIAVVAVVGAAAARLAWKVVDARARGVQLAVMAVGVAVAAGGALWFHPWRDSAQTPPRLGLIVVANGDRRSLTVDDIDALTPRVGGIAPVARKNAQLVSEDNNWNAVVNGTTPAYFELRNWRPTSGALFTQADLDASAKVVVLGSAPATQLFGETEPLGKTVILEGTPFTVVAVLAPKSPQDDDVAVVPLTTFRTKIGRSGTIKSFDGILFIAGATPDAVRAILRDRHQLAPGDEDDFILRDLR